MLVQNEIARKNSTKSRIWSAKGKIARWQIYSSQANGVPDYLRSFLAMVRRTGRCPNLLVKVSSTLSSPFPKIQGVRTAAEMRRVKQDIMPVIKLNMKCRSCSVLIPIPMKQPIVVTIEIAKAGIILRSTFTKLRPIKAWLNQLIMMS